MAQGCVGFTHVRDMRVIQEQRQRWLEQGCVNISRGRCRRPDCTRTTDIEIECDQCDHAFPTVANLKKHESKDV